MYGPHQKKQSLIPNILQSIKIKEKPEILSPTNKNDFIFVGDVCNAIIKTFKSNGFTLSEPDVLLDSEYIIQRSGENFRRSMLTFENEDGKVMCLRPDLTVASCVKFLEKKSKSKIIIQDKLIEEIIKKALI